MAQGMTVLAAVEHYAQQTPESLALAGQHSSLSYAQLLPALSSAEIAMRGVGSVIGLAVDNDPVWAVLDLAALRLDLPVVPLPFFFSPEQIGHAIRDAGVDLLITDQAAAMKQILASQGIAIVSEATNLLGGKLLAQLQLQVSRAELPKGTSKVTYTSGTTGKPKGVCLSSTAMQQVAQSLQQATNAVSDDRHLSLLPLTTLLENIAGLYVPLLAGATSILLPSAQVGLSGAAGLDVGKMLSALSNARATTTVMTPELLYALVSVVEAGFPRPADLRFIAVGGASVSPRLLERAAAAGLPVFEGYGLSECSSVVAVNTEQENRPGTVGKPLPHARLKFAEDGEILVQGACLLGYTAQPAALEKGYWATGDIGHLDDDGYLHITGRKKNIFITSFGRNVAPEWVERELVLSMAIAQAAVFGEARPWNAAVIVPAAGVSAMDIDLAIAEVNRQLPDYAQVHAWISVDAPFLPQNGLLTANGRLRREAIWQIYQNRINALYEESRNAVL
ncbi:MAG TPA: AMP-binding protein [Methylophilaceae bacterium]|nr:AMP-binding protein [Methylophilaceae bacterium]